MAGANGRFPVLMVNPQWDEHTEKGEQLLQSFLLPAGEDCVVYASSSQ
jgi:hypothetical protein